MNYNFILHAKFKLNNFVKVKWFLNDGYEGPLS